MAGPLSGIRVVDLTSMISGPLATMILADQGAEVIKIERPDGGDHARKVAGRRGGFSASFLNNNRGKRSVALDLKRPEAVEAAKRLVAGADVVVQNFRPGVAERIGLGEAALRAVRPDLVYASISGFGHEGPWVHKPVYDPLIQALSGLATVQGGSDDLRPRLIRTILPDKLTAIQAAQAITAALLARARTGEGTHVRLSMLDTVVAFLWSSDMTGHTFVGDETPDIQAQSFVELIYASADGHLAVSAYADRDWRGLCRAVGRPDWLEDPRFATVALREENKPARLELTQSELEKRGTAEWIARLEAEDVPCAPVLTRAEMIRHPQIAANGLIREIEHPQAGRLRQTRPAATFSATPAEAGHPARRLGEDTAAVLAEAGYDAGEIAALMAGGAARGLAAEEAAE
ncbi:CoA transferase [Paralimibaculum aggregatum]|uniref:CoA transferase n=1 Tax=Paralimibaculum aggregatum TaxID=3036245 RepID=A0ABQ6LQW4_9RHOB|nr:CoA transferase [Limibaculum sp. NKW23]GMG83474.1 CoA transferase [Limibaculum sp. NKW23]